MASRSAQVSERGMQGVAHARAQHDGSLRYLRVEVVAGNALTVVGSGSRGSSLEVDFDSLSQEVQEATPAIFLVALDEEELWRVTGKGAQPGEGATNGVDGGASATRWLLVSWIPDDSKVRDKMLYSSSRQDLKQGLGLGFFEGEYYANVHGDMSYESFVASRRSGSGDQLLSEAEVLKRELNKQERASDVGMKSSAMGIIPFKLTDELRAQLHAFSGDEADVNWVEMRMEGEQVVLQAAKTVAEDELLKDLVTEEEPRFILLQRHGTKFLVYSCPEESPVRVKMTYSSSKASVVAATAEAGGKVDHTVEIRAAGDIDEAIAQAFRTSAEQAGADTGGSLMGGDRAGVLAPAPAVSRPSRPGRGRARLTRRSN